MSKKRPTPFAILQHRVAEVHWRWRVWKKLFAADAAKPDDLAKRYELMNNWGPSFFAMLQSALLEDVVLRICRLNDPEFLNPRHLKRSRNLSLETAISDASRQFGSTAQCYARNLLRKFQRSIKPLTAWRDNRIAHEDHRTAMGEDELPRLQFKRIEQCLAAAAGLMEMLDAESAEFAYSEMHSRGDGESLLYALRCASQYHKECIEHSRPMIR